jgi:hypothetical protein
MGSELYWYVVPYEEDKNKALQQLRIKEFEAGRYNPVMRHIDFPITAQSESPGKGHETIEEAFKAAEADGTRSILDLMTVSEEDDYFIARILEKEKVIEYFGTDKPTKDAVMGNNFFPGDIGRGKGLCITTYENENPTELLFIGWSFD